MMSSTLLTLYSRLYASARGARIGLGTIVHPGASIDARGRGEVTVGDNCEIHRGVLLWAYGGSIRIGNHSTVNPYSVIYGHGGVIIGSYVRIATHVVIIPANHVFTDCSRPIARQGLTSDGIRIEDDVWIGAGARVLDGIRIARGCVIAAGAVVTKSTIPLGVYAGVPARCVAMRGDDQAPEPAGVLEVSQ